MVLWLTLFIIVIRYVLLILGMSCLYEISLTILDYEMKLIAVEESSPLSTDSTESTTNFYNEATEKVKGTFASFMSTFGLTTNIISFVFSLFLLRPVLSTYRLPKTLR